MTLVAYTGWCCLTCGAKQLFPDPDDPCCPDYTLIRVLVDEPDQAPAADDEAGGQA